MASVPMTIVRHYAARTEVQRIVKQTQAQVGVKPTGVQAMLPEWREALLAAGKPNRPIHLAPKRKLWRPLKRLKTKVGIAELKELKEYVEPGMRGPYLASAITPRKLLAHEIAHQTRAGRLAVIKGRGTPKAPYPRWLAGHGPWFKSARRHVEKIMKKSGALKRLRKIGYEITW